MPRFIPIGLVVLCLGALASPAAGQWKAGVAKVKITPQQLEERLRNGDATLLTTLLSSPLVYQVFEAAMSEGEGDGAGG